MAKFQQVKVGVIKYVYSDILPHLDGWRKIVLGAYVNLLFNNIDNIFKNYKDNQAISILNIIQDDEIDLDKLHEALNPLFENNQKYTIEIPSIGDLTINKSDIEKIYKFIKEA